MLSYITLGHAQALKLQPLSYEELNVETFMNTTTQKIKAPVYEVIVNCINEDKKSILVRGVTRITDDLLMASKRTTDSKVLFETVKPKILIGSDYLWKFLDSEQLVSGFYLVKTQLGNVICGQGPTVTNTPAKNVHAFTVASKYSNPDKLYDKVIEEHIKLDVGGLNGDPKLTEKEIAIRHFNETYQRDEDGTFVVRLPWKTDNPDLKSNLGLAFARLQSTFSNLQKRGLATEYVKFYDVHKQRKFIERVENGLAPEPEKMVHYLAHHAVVKESATTPLRAVFDCSAKQHPNDHSLNNLLYAGPPDMPDLIGMVIRFRCYPIVVAADIEKAFMMMKLAEQDRDVFRFLLPIDPEKPISWDNVEVWRYTCPLFGAASSPFHLDCCINKLLDEEKDAVAEELKGNVLVDNTLLGANTPDEAKLKAKSSEAIFKKANMNLRDHISNSPEVSEFMNSTVPESTSFLGIKWKPKEDVIYVNIPHAKTVKKVTKRTVLSFIASVFDPLGIVAPVVFAGKVFLHSLWAAQHKWDTPLNDDELKKWNKFKETTEGKQIKLRRYIFNKNAVRREIYVFVDASEKGIAAVAYIREILKNGEIRVHLIICKTRIAPANYATISRLELMAIVLGAALLKFLLKELPFTVNSTTIFSDSTCAIGWINSSEKHGRFIDNRKNFIREIVTDIQHVRGPDNSADPASRGCTVAELVSCPKWLHGPHWLQLDKKFWPPPTLNHIALERAITPPSSIKEVEQPVLSCDSSTAVQENVKNIEEKINLPPNVTTLAVTGNHYFDLGIDAERISKWQPLIGAVAAMLFFIKNCGKNAASTFLKLLSNVVANSYRNPKMLYFAETSIFLNIQRKFPPSQNVQRELKLKYNELGLLVCSHRIPNATADELIWLPECHETYLLILHIHTKLMHAGPRHTLNELRRRFWICKGKQVVNKLLRRQCFHCRRLKVKPYKLPDMPDLPRERVEMAHPFKYCGVDLCGPYMIKVQQQLHKYWICLFTCMVTRNIHLELCPGLDGNSFILAFRRFVARYCKPSLIQSDNATNFVAAKKFIEPSWNIANDAEFNDYVVSEKLEWRFIKEKSPWKGGIWERLIGIVKNSLQHAIGRKILDFHEFHTVISEIETIINTRPISAVDPEYNPNATNMALRPIDFIAPYVTVNYPPSYDPADCTYCDKESTEEVLNKLYQFTAHIRDQFWNKFAHDYLNQLREAATHFHKQSKFTEISPEPGSVVLVEEENIPLNGWKLGVIVALNESDDNCIRTAKVKVPSGRILNRPLCQLYPLEVQVNDPSTIQKTPAESESANDNSTPSESIQPRYNFRPRQKVSKTFFVLALCACLVLGAAATECQSSTVDLKLVYAENCTSSGFAIFQNVDDSYCWQHVDCGIYHLHDYSQLPGNDNHICTDTCKCPAWADDCTFYESSLSEVEKKSVLHLINDETPHENDAIVHIIQLPDGTDHIIRQLNLIKEDALDDIICFGSGQTFNGPPNFCANRTCDSNASKLCLMRHHELVFAAVHNGKISIKAWKTLERPPKIPTFHPQPQLPASCDDGKIILNNTENIRRVQVQSGNSYTVFIPNSTNLIMELPTALVTASREFQLTYWNKHESYNITHVICPAIDYCTQIKPCWFCTAELLNPECRPVKSILMISNLISLLYIILHKLCKKRRRNRRKSSSLPLFIKRKNSDEDIFVRFRKLSAGVVLPTISICIICIILIPGIEADGEDLSLTAKSQECTVNSHGFASCKISEVTQLTISTAKTSTLLINYEGRPLGSIKIIPEVHLTCQKMTQHYTRIVDIKTASLKICGGRSLCSGNECAMSTSDLRVPAFGTANNLPGNTFCHESCGGWFCKCVTWGEACLYFRNYASPADPRTIEVFSCDGFHTTLILNVTITTQQSSTNRILTLQEGHSAEINKIKISALDINPEDSPPPQHSLYLNTGKTIAVLNDVGASAANLLQCSDIAAATEFKNCTLQQACKCHPADGIASCSCLENTVLQKLLNDNALPMLQNNHWLRPSEDNNVIVDIPAHPRIQISIQEFSLFAAIDMNSCSATVHKIEGCSSCLEGAIADITCTTDFGQAEGHVVCSGMSFPLQCHKSGYFQKVTLFFNKVNVDEQCELRCPSKVAKISFHATLKKSTFVNPWSKIVADVQSEPPLIPAIIEAVSHFVQSSYTYMLITLGIAAVVALLLLKFLI